MTLSRVVEDRWNGRDGGERIGGAGGRLGSSKWQRGKEGKGEEKKPGYRAARRCGREEKTRGSRAGAVEQRRGARGRWRGDSEGVAAWGRRGWAKGAHR